MCQLTLTDLKQKRYNNLFLYLSFMNNSKAHKDGFGFLSNKTDIYKSEKCPRTIDNLSAIISTMNNSDEMILSHVRQISVGKVANENDSHPFEMADFVLAHNGTLKWKDKKNEDKFPGKIDSEAFALELQEEYSTNSNFVDCIKKTYAKFTGKFAFLIYNKREDKFYVVRGKLAKLHLANIFKMEGEEIVSIGNIVNTELESVKDAIEAFIDVVELIDSIIVDYKVEEIKEEHIYEYDGVNLIELAEIKENYEVKIYDRYDDDGWYANSRNRGGYYHNNNSTKIERIASFLSENLLDLTDLDNLCFVLFGKCLLECYEADVNLVVLNEFAKINSGSKKRYWTELKRYVTTDELYVKYQLNYPYFINTKRKLSLALNTLKKEMAEQRKKK